MDVDSGPLAFPGNSAFQRHSGRAGLSSFNRGQRHAFRDPHEETTWGQGQDEREWCPEHRGWEWCLAPAAGEENLTILRASVRMLGKSLPRSGVKLTPDKTWLWSHLTNLKSETNEDRIVPSTLNHTRGQSSRILCGIKKNIYIYIAPYKVKCVMPTIQSKIISVQINRKIQHQMKGRSIKPTPKWQS